MQSIKYTAIILAGGLSKRFKKDKLIYKINNEMIINHSIENFKNDLSCEKIFLVVHSSKYDFYKQLFRFVAKIVLVVAESTRILSFKKVFEQVKSEYVIVHDAARPYLKVDLLNDVKNELLFKAGAVVPIVNICEPLVHIKKGEQKQLYQDDYFVAQTPQGYSVESIKEIMEETHSLDIFQDINDVYEIFNVHNKEIKFISGDLENKLIVVEVDAK